MRAGFRFGAALFLTALFLTALLCLPVFWAAPTMGAPKPVSGPLEIRTLEPGLLESHEALQWYDPESLKEGTFLFNNQGKRALLVVKPCDNGKRWVAGSAKADDGSITLRLKQAPAAESGDWRTEPVLVQLPQVDAGDGRTVAVVFEPEE